jgi:hypothetical protein
LPSNLPRVRRLMADWQSGQQLLFSNQPRPVFRDSLATKKTSEKALPKEAFALHSLTMAETVRSNVKKLAISFLHVSTRRRRSLWLRKT